MSRIRKMCFKAHGFVSVLTMCAFLFASISVSAAVEGQAPSFMDQVEQLSQACQDGKDLTVEQLQEIITRCDTLNEAVKKSDNPQKKLIIIRLNKTRDLCLYLQQLQQRN